MQHGGRACCTRGLQQSKSPEPPIRLPRTEPVTIASKRLQGLIDTGIAPWAIPSPRVEPSPFVPYLSEAISAMHSPQTATSRSMSASVAIGGTSIML